MKIHPHFYPLILIAAFVLFMLIGFLLGFLPERGAEGHSRSALIQIACLVPGNRL